VTQSRAPLQIIASGKLQYTLSVGKRIKVCYLLNGMYKFSKDLLECIDISSLWGQVTDSRVVKVKEWKIDMLTAY